MQQQLLIHCKQKRFYFLVEAMGEVGFGECQPFVFYLNIMRLSSVLLLLLVATSVAVCAAAPASEGDVAAFVPESSASTTATSVENWPEDREENEKDEASASNSAALLASASTSASVSEATSAVEGGEATSAVEGGEATTALFDPEDDEDAEDDEDDEDNEDAHDEDEDENEEDEDEAHDEDEDEDDEKDDGSDTDEDDEYGEYDNEKEEEELQRQIGESAFRWCVFAEGCSPPELLPRCAYRASGTAWPKTYAGREALLRSALLCAALLRAFGVACFVDSFIIVLNFQVPMDAF